MPRIIRTPFASRDFSAIALYLADKSLDAALNWMDGIDHTLQLLSHNPLLGEAVDHLEQGVRRHTYDNYLLFYKPLEDGIELRRILHGSRRIERLSD
ncbi:MAG: type II toxin-antitoxin system RelE/ParE family toxin [Bythopirellula sp.]|nr:type II toxin-antitoxin system RelE/ParE family toxin [Bythopirellula sp.]